MKVTQWVVSLSAKRSHWGTQKYFKTKRDANKYARRYDKRRWDVKVNKEVYQK